MPYALFCKEAKLSKTYPTEADVWKLARHSGLVVDAASEHGGPIPSAVLDTTKSGNASRTLRRIRTKTRLTPSAKPRVTCNFRRD